MRLYSICSKEQVNPLTEGIKRRKFHSFLSCLMETPFNQPEIGNLLTLHTPRLVELGRKALQKVHRDPDADPESRNAVVRNGECRNQQVLKKIWEREVYEEGQKGEENRRVQVEYVRETNTADQQETDVFALELAEFIKGGREACGTVLQKPTGHSDAEFEMKNMSVLSARSRRILGFGEEPLQDSEIVDAMGQVLLQIIAILEQEVVGAEYRAEILGPIQRLLRVS